MLSTLIALAAASLTAHASTLNSIYGEDSRQDVKDVQDARVRAWARSTLAVIDDARLSRRQDGKFTLSARSYAETYKLCDGERFAAQPSVAKCSAALVAPDLVLTAKHCVEGPSACAGTSLVFDYAIDSSSRDPLVLPASSVYHCKEIVATHGGATASDLSEFAVLRLDRAVTDRLPLALRREGSVALGQKLVSIGAPAGIPLKVATGRVTGVDGGPTFYANVDTFHGSSGGPVLNASSGVIEGVLTRGRSDHLYDPSRGCYEEAKYAEENTPGGEVVTLASLARPHVPEATPAPQPSASCLARTVTYLIEGVRPDSLQGTTLPANLSELEPIVRARVGEVARKRLMGIPLQSARLKRIAAATFSLPANDILCSAAAGARQLQVRSGPGITALGGKDRRGRPIAGFSLVRSDEFYLSETVNLDSEPSSLTTSR